jgi:hypothetical protein
MDAPTASIVTASLALLGTLVVAILSWNNARRTEERVAALEKEKAERADEMARKKTVHDARVDYEYEARKRLYAQCEPLLFQFFELAEEASSRVKSLARTARDDDLRPDGSGWLDREGYYLQSTAYALLAPLAAIRILQSRLTLVDLGMDAGFESQYQLMRILYRTFREDHSVAKQAGLDYKPDKADPEEKGAEDLKAGSPAVYVRQGFYRGTLDRIVQSLIVSRKVGDRVMFYGEFLDALNGSAPEAEYLRGSLRAVFLGFHPQSRPVLWRLLISQVLLYEALDRTRNPVLRDRGDLRSLFAPPSESLVAELDWRGAGSDQSIDPADAVDAASRYVLRCVAERDVTRLRTSAGSAR